MEQYLYGNDNTENLDIFDHQLGPDYIIPSNECHTWHRDGATKIQLTRSHPMAPEPISIPTAFKRTVNSYSDKTAFYIERDFCSKWSFRQFYDQVRIVAKAFIKLGLRRFHTVAILGYNSPEWVVAEVAAIFAGGLSAGIYPTSLPDACKYILNDSKANICMVENDFQLQKILEIKSELPHLKAIVQWSGTPSNPEILSWDELLNIGRSVPYDVLDRRLRGISINQPCFISYTSGTLAQPKAALINHDSIIYYNWICFSQKLQVTSKDCMVSYLPMNHIGAQGVDVFPCILQGITIHFAKSDALKRSLMDTLLVAKPTVFLGVPRTWEQIYEKLKLEEQKFSLPKKAICNWAKRIGLKHSRNQITNGRTPFMYNMAKKLFLDKVKASVGLSKARYLLCGTAPIDQKILEYFWSHDMLVLEVYGLTETLGFISINADKNVTLGSVGKTIEYMEIMLDSMTNSGEGEICYRGRIAFVGYLNKEKETRETIDTEEWLHTGDIGRIDDKGFLYITGRKKEILITSGGENIAPVPIENRIKQELHIISNAMVIGDRKKYLSVVLTLKTNLDECGVSTGILTNNVQIWLKERGCNATSVNEVISNINDNTWLGIQSGIDAVNKLTVSNTTNVQKWIILPRDFSVVTGEIGPTLKLCRNVVMKNFKHLIDAMYEV